MSFNELGNMDAEVVEAIWGSYLTRKHLLQIESDRRDQVLSLQANGMVDKESYEKQMQQIQAIYEHSKRIVLGTNEDVIVEDAYLTDARSSFIQAAKAPSG